MRHNDARKWLHAGLDLLPLILIPIFMVYSHRHTIEGGSIAVPYNKVVDFNQQIINSADSWSPNFYTYDSLNGYYVVNSDDNYLTRLEQPQNYILGHKIYYSVDILNDNAQELVVMAGSYGIDDISEGSRNANYSNNWQTLKFVNYSNSNSSFKFIIGTNTVGAFSFKFKNYMAIDLTQMFGAGNEPTIAQFDSWYSNDYYSYTLSHKELLKGYSEVTYDDNDIMSQFTYQLYNSVDKYFNMGNVFNLGGVYDWFNLNIFGGNAPIAVYIVWQVVLYEFVMDLLFLLYGLFMWFIDMMKHLMEKPFRSIK